MTNLILLLKFLTISLKTLLRKTHWDKNSVKEKEYTIIISVASLKTLPGKSSGTKPWLREKECNMILSPPEKDHFDFLT